MSNQSHSQITNPNAFGFPADPYELAATGLNFLAQALTRMASAQRRASPEIADRMSPHLLEAMRLYREMKHHYQAAGQALAAIEKLGLASNVELLALEQIAKTTQPKE